LDTRSKILAPAEAFEAARRVRAQGRDIALTTGWFDPLVPAHARRLSGLKDGVACLMVLITEPPQPVLPARARAELVAALAAVDFVVIPEPGSVDALIAELRTATVSRGEAEDQQIVQDLIRHVHTRQGAS
jgi:bifunctional ADP-heptose synthase (sugar kinase/adenylyltransferase)